MRFRKSKTLEMIMRHWMGRFPNDASEVEFPFNIQNFCLENDTILNIVLGSHDEPQKMWTQTVFLPLTPFESKVVWAVYRDDAPIAWFANYEDAARFIYGNEVGS